ncbi:MAG: hypothetical protein WC455_09345 [Dehalococcoidia bacterium]|jgi:hypothetical protein
MDHPAHEETYRGHRIKVFQDESPESPRDWDNVGTMVCWHRNYKLGDEQPKCSPTEWKAALAAEFDPGITARIERMSDKAWDRREQLISQGYDSGSRMVKEARAEAESKCDSMIESVLDKHIVILPLYLYDHSGITMSTGRFSCPWDSGQVGFIYCTKETIRKELSRPQPLKKGQERQDYKPIKNVTKKDLAHAEEYLRREVKTYDQYLTGDVYGFVIEGLDDEEGNSCWGFFGMDDCIESAKLEVDANIKYLESPEYKNKVVTAEAEAYADIMEGALCCG